MAFTLTAWYGFDDQGSALYAGVGGTPTYETTNARSKASSTTGRQARGAAVVLTSTANINLAAVQVGSSAGDSECIGFALRVPSTPSAGDDILRAIDSSGDCWTLEFGTSSVLRLLDSTGSTIASGTATISTGTWYFIEIVWDASNSGNIDLFVNGTSDISASSQDLLVSAFSDLYSFNPSGATIWVDDVYCASGLTATSDRLGDAEVFTFQTDKASTTPDAGGNGASGTATLGNWVNVGDTPVNTSNNCLYTSDPAYGSVDIPISDLVDGDSNIKGYSSLYYALRTNGSATTHYFFEGDSGDGNSPSAQTPSLTTGYVYYPYFRTTNLPTSSQSLRMGFGRNGARLITLGDMWGMLLHVPGGGSVTGTATSLLSAIAQAATGVMEPEGTAVNLLQQVTQNAVGEETISGTGVNLLQQIQQNAVGEQTISGAANQLLQQLQQSAVGVEIFSGVGVNLLQAIQQNATGVMHPSGTAVSLLQEILQSATGIEIFVGTAVNLLQEIQQNAVGVMHPSGEAVSLLQQILQNASGTSGTPSHTGTAVSLLQQIAQNGVGIETISGTAVSLLQQILQNATGVMQPSGTAVSLLQQILQNATGTHELASASGAAISLLQQIIQAGNGVEIFAGTGTQLLLPVTQSASGFQIITGSASQLLQQITQNASGEQIFTGTASQLLQQIEQAAQGEQPYIGTANQLLQQIQQSGVGVESIPGTASQLLQQITQYGLQVPPNPGTAQQQLQMITQVAYGLVLFLDLWVPEGSEAGSWSAEAGASDTWTPETPPSNSWTPEDST